MPKLIDMTGWNMWEHGVPRSNITVLYYKEKQGKKHYWHCKCNLCGNEFDAQGYHLRAGEINSCGCGKKGTRLPYKEHIGERFGKLTILERLEYDIKGHDTFYKCQCDCGNIRTIRYGSLLRGANSCGCEKQSIGEQAIIQILKSANIPFIHNQTYFKDLYGVNNGLLRYDFILFKDGMPVRLIEFDGIQHEKIVDFFGGEEHFQRLQANDNIKNEYAKNHNIPLIRIPYKELNNLSLELLLNDKYLIT